MKISEIGQFGMIDKIAAMIERKRDPRVESWKGLITGVGDDCAVWKGDPANQYAKVDCQVQGVHFNLDWITWEELGWKALAVNLSDIAAMGGIPSYALVSLGLPPDSRVEDIVDLYTGLLNLAKLSGTAVVGGNLSGSPVVFVDICLIGKAGNPEGKSLSRSAARPGDLIAVSGWLGSAAAGLKMLREEMALDITSAMTLKQAFALPEPRLKEGQLTVEKGVKAGIDISDGLLADLGHMLKASRVGAVVRIDQLPILPPVLAAFGDQSLDMALSGGEDYQLLLTAPASVIGEVQRSSSYPITVIGEIVESAQPTITLLNKQGKVYHTPKTGWDHFKHLNK
jgi:thiamine-monophosphate kinase